MAFDTITLLNVKTSMLATLMSSIKLHFALVTSICACNYDTKTVTVFCQRLYTHVKFPSVEGVSMLF